MKHREFLASIVPAIIPILQAEHRPARIFPFVGAGQDELGILGSVFIFDDLQSVAIWIAHAA